MYLLTYFPAFSRYVTKALRFDPNKMVVATLKFIGTDSEVARQEAEVMAVAKKHGGRSAGAVSASFVFLVH